MTETTEPVELERVEVPHEEPSKMDSGLPIAPAALEAMQRAGRIPEGAQKQGTPVTAGQVLPPEEGEEGDEAEEDEDDIPAAPTEDQLHAVVQTLITAGTELTGAGYPTVSAVNRDLAAQNLAPVTADQIKQSVDTLPVA